MSQPRLEEFERRYQALLRDNPLKHHRPCKLRIWALHQYRRSMEKAERSRGVSDSRFKNAVADAEKFKQVMLVLRDLKEKEQAA